MPSERAEPKVPADLRKALAASSSSGKLWNDLTPLARRDFILWVDSAKQAETRTRRIERIGSMLASGKRRPCCFSIVPMNLYKALGAMPKAKARWGTLSSDERRDFVDWIGGSGTPEERRRRVERTCMMLAAGKRTP